MHFHTPFHPFQRRPITPSAVEMVNLLLILLGVILVLLFRPYSN